MMFEGFVLLLSLGFFVVLIIGFFMMVSRLGKIADCTQRMLQFNRAMYSNTILQADEDELIVCQKCKVTILKGSSACPFCFAEMPNE